MPTKQMLRSGHERLRAKLSTTVAPETYAYLERLVTRGEASNLAEALDAVVRRQIEQERHAELERRMAEYYDTLSDEDIAEDRVWGEFATHAMVEPGES